MPLPTASSRTGEVLRLKFSDRNVSFERYHGTGRRRDALGSSSESQGRKGKTTTGGCSEYASAAIGSDSETELNMSNAFFDHPILNSPYEYPARYWELDISGQPTQKIIETRRRAEFI